MIISYKKRSLTFHIKYQKYSYFFSIQLIFFLLILQKRSYLNIVSLPTVKCFLDRAQDWISRRWWRVLIFFRVITIRLRLWLIIKTLIILGREQLSETIIMLIRSIWKRWFVKLLLVFSKKILFSAYFLLLIHINEDFCEMEAYSSECTHSFLYSQSRKPIFIRKFIKIYHWNKMWRTYHSVKEGGVFGLYTCEWPF